MNDKEKLLELNESPLDIYGESTDYESKKALLRKKIENGFREIAEGKCKPFRQALADIEREIFG